VFANILANDPKAKSGPSRPGPAAASLLRPDEFVGAGRSHGLGYIFWRKEGESSKAGPLAKNIGEERTGHRQQLALPMATPFSSPATEKFVSSRVRRALVPAS
jgi:hypothetical protein